METKSWIRLAFWFGALADAVVAVGMVVPILLQRVLALSAVPSGVEVRCVLGMGASLMLGWTLLLLWASLEPVERRGVLLLTVAPVIAGLALATLFGHVGGYIPTRGAVSVWALQAVLVTAMLTAWVAANRLDRRGADRDARRVGR